MKKHAYLIMAHMDFYVLKKLLLCLDDDRNDIYLHVDVKAKEVPWDTLKSIIHHSQIYLIHQTSIRWGAFSQICCELKLLEEAKKHDTYVYYHLLSGSDLPLKTQDVIHAFYDENEGKEFVHFVNDDLIKEKHCYERLRYYSFFQGYSKHPSIFVRGLFACFNAISIHVQQLLHMDRIRHIEKHLAFGTNWFSITDALATYVLSNKNWIQQHFQHTRCADEMFLQMIVYNSSFYENVYHLIKEDNFNGFPIMRFIDWERGNPYVFTKDDVEQLLRSPYFFARKFDSRKDRIAVDEISKNLISSENDSKI